MVSFDSSPYKGHSLTRVKATKLSTRPAAKARQEPTANHRYLAKDLNPNADV
jgi:hypothetical protein